MNQTYDKSYERILNEIRSDGKLFLPMIRYISKKDGFDPWKYDVVIVGAGITGATIAERYASQLNKKVLIIKRRNHLAGNCYDFKNKDGLLINKYSGHIFHTNDEGVWKYVNRFSEWRLYYHKVLAYVDGKYVPIPANITTLNTIFNLCLNSPEEAEQWFNKNTEKIKNPKNSEEMALARVGRHLYDKLFKNYTIKQWDPRDLEASVMARIPVRKSREEGYFDDKYQAIPLNGYTEFIKSMLNHQNITILMNSDFFELRNKLEGFKKMFFTGRIDQYFNKIIKKKLQYRSLRLEFTTYEREYYLPAATVNYPNDYDATRVVEYKYITGQQHPYTTAPREWNTWDGEPYYSVPTEENRNLYSRYQRLSEKEQKYGLYFVGRLANYKYFNMDQAIRNALNFSTMQNVKISKKIALCMVTYKREKDLSEVLTSAIHQTLTIDRIIVHDNNSNDCNRDLITQLKSIYPRIDYTESPNNMGVARTFEKFLRDNYKSFECIYLTDDDVIFHPDTLKNLVESQPFRDYQFGFWGSLVLDSESHCIAPINFPEVIPKTNIEIINGCQKGYLPIRTCSFTDILINTVAVRKVGFPYGDFVIYTDDYEYSMRISQNFPCYLVTKSIFFHKGGRLVSFADAPLSQLWKHYYATGNLFFVYKEHRKIYKFFGDRLLILTQAIKKNKLRSWPYIHTIFKGTWAGFNFKPKD